MNDMIHANLEIAYFDARDARSEVPAQVMFAGPGLTLVAPDATGTDVLWHGERRGQGHFVLSAETAGMEASLHRFADSTILEGFWRSGPERGFWRLHLPLDAVIPQDSPPQVPTRVRKRSTAGTRKRVRRTA